MARFQPVEAFHPAEGTLELLPFRFERTEGRYLVSNIVGDFIRLSSDELTRIVELRRSTGGWTLRKGLCSPFDQRF